MVQRYDRGVPLQGTPQKKYSNCAEKLIVEYRNGPICQFFRDTIVWVGQDEVWQLRIQNNVFIIDDDISCILRCIVCKPRGYFHSFAMAHSRINVIKIC